MIKQLKVMQITPQVIDRFRNDFNEAMQKLEKKHGVKVSLGGATYDSTMFRAKVTVKAIPDGGALSEKEEFSKLASRFGFKPQDFGRSFQQGRTIYTLIGFKPSRRKYPVILKKGNAQVFGNVTWVKENLDKNEIR